MLEILPRDQNQQNRCPGSFRRSRAKTEESWSHCVCDGRRVKIHCGEVKFHCGVTRILKVRIHCVMQRYIGSASALLIHGISCVRALLGELRHACAMILIFGSFVSVIRYIWAFFSTLKRIHLQSNPVHVLISDLNWMKCILEENIVCHFLCLWCNLPSTVWDASEKLSSELKGQWKRCMRLPKPIVRGTQKARIPKFQIVTQSDPEYVVSSNRYILTGNILTGISYPVSPNRYILTGISWPGLQSLDPAVTTNGTRNIYFADRLRSRLTFPGAPTKVCVWAYVCVFVCGAACKLIHTRAYVSSLLCRYWITFHCSFFHFGNSLVF